MIRNRFSGSYRRLTDRSRDLALHPIARFCGPEHAARSAKVCLLAVHEGGQLPFAADRARELLEAGKDSIEDVGHAVGYEDPTFFRRLFKRTTGLTPAAYRRKYVPIVASA